MKIALINELYGTKRQGGEQEALNNLAEKLRGLNFTVDIYTYTAPDQTLKIKTFFPLWLRQLPFVRDILVLPVVGRKLLNKIADRYQIIISSSATLFSLSPTKVPVLIISHALRSQKADYLKKIKRYCLFFNPLIRKILKFWEIRGFRKAAKVVVLKSTMKDYLVNQLDLQTDKITVIPNAVEINQFKPLTAKNNKTVLFVGRGTINKGIDTLMAAAPMIKAPITVVTKIISPELLRQGQKQRINFLFDVPHARMPEIYQRAAIFILPSLDEEQPLTILEAMSCGLPIITTKIGSGGLVVDQINGLIIPARSPQKLAIAVNKLIMQETLREKIGFANRQCVINNYCWSVVLPQFINILKQIR